MLSERQTENSSAGTSATGCPGNETDDNNRPIQASPDAEWVDEVDPWRAISRTEHGFNYDEIIERLNCKKIDRQLIEKMEVLIRRPVHHLISRNIAVSHRDMDRIMEGFKVSQGIWNDSFYLYTGRGPSSKTMHLGHAIPFILTKWFQDTFNTPLVIQITDDEKFLWKDIQIDDATTMAHENIKDIIAFGFDPKKTFIFTDIQYMRPEFYKNICRIEKLCNVMDIKDRFGFEDDDCIGKLTFPAIQAAPSFSSSFPEFFNGRKDIPCLIPCAIDQDSIFRMARETAPKLGSGKPAVLHTKFLASLKGQQWKMSASHPEGAIFLTDDKHVIDRKIQNCDREILFQYLSYFMEDNRRFEQKQEEYSSGSLSTANLKKELLAVLTKFVTEFKRRRNNISEERFQKFMSPKK
ncbi:tryptophan--tRNA ligase, cytoplasmic-like isoform X1 [Mercenaria mercenaria]|uniref:tryptophan--tRNA ligase, cytoplasmic-like isoform X1 n=1 Tax=Mercenaria mercenaria TaxID=6596 RepID=UPI00234EC4CE|nr:tryptophan--tRNA ligase, cytoplasmic-like isoform X1 [Mercenaria mercenaria]